MTEPCVVIVAAIGAPRSPADRSNEARPAAVVRNRPGEPPVQSGTAPHPWRPPPGRRPRSRRSGRRPSRCPCPRGRRRRPCPRSRREPRSGSRWAAAAVAARRCPPRKGSPSRCRSPRRRSRSIRPCAAPTVTPGRDHVGLDPVVGRRSPAGERRQVRAFRAIRRAGHGRPLGDRPHGDGGRRRPRRGDRADPVAAVTGRRNDDLARGGRRIDGQGQRVQPVGGHVRAEAERDHVDAWPSRRTIARPRPRASRRRSPWNRAP